MTKFNAANSEYNKDANFAKLTLTEASKIEFSEAVAIDGDKSVMVYCHAEKIPGVQAYEKGWNFQPTLVKFELLKEDKGDKAKTTPAQQLICKKLGEFGFGKPFSGFIGLDIQEKSLAALTTGCKPNGTPYSEIELNMIAEIFFEFSPLEKLDKLEGKEMKAPSGGGGSLGKGGGGQKESERLLDRMAFIKTAIQSNSDFRNICADLGEDPEACLRVMLTAIIN